MLGERWGQGRDRALRERLGIQLQETQLNDKLTVEETLRLFRSSAERGRTVDEVLALVELEEKRSSLGGQALGRAEAAAGGGLRAGGRARPAVPRRAHHRARSAVAPPALGPADAYRADGGTILLTTHYMDEAERLCDRVAIVDHGKVIALGTPRALIARSAPSTSSSSRWPTARRSIARRWPALPGVGEARLENGAWSLATSEVHLAVPALLAHLSAAGRGPVASHHAQRDARGRLRRAHRKAPARCVTAAAPIHRWSSSRSRGCASSCASPRRCSGSSCSRSCWRARWASRSARAATSRSWSAWSTRRRQQP